MKDLARDAAPRIQLTAGRLIPAAILCGVALAAAILWRWDYRARLAQIAFVDAAVGASEDAREAALARAERALRGPLATGELHDLAADLALSRTPPDYAAAETHSLAALGRSPSRAHAWARLAYAEAIEVGELTEAGNGFLLQSYLVEPFSPDELRHWRLEFTFSYWRDLDPQVREAAVREARAFAHEAPERNWMLRFADTLPPAPAAALRDAVERGRRL